MNWIVEPSYQNDKQGNQLACSPIIFFIIGGCLITILCSDLCVVHCWKTDK